MRKWDWNWKKLSIVIVNVSRAYFSSCHKILQKWKYWTIMIKNVIYISGFSIDPLQFNATPLKNPLILSFKNQTMGGTFPKNFFLWFCRRVCTYSHGNNDLHLSRNRMNETIRCSTYTYRQYWENHFREMYRAGMSVKCIEVPWKMAVKTELQLRIPYSLIEKKMIYRHYI